MEKSKRVRFAMMIILLIKCSLLTAGINFVKVVFGKIHVFACKQERYHEFIRARFDIFSIWILDVWLINASINSQMPIYKFISQMISRKSSLNSERNIKLMRIRI